MEDYDITDPLFREAVEAIDTGNMTALKHLLEKHPGLVRQRLDAPGEGYFKHPYLLWFVADNPIRIDKLPPNIVEVTRLLVQAVQQGAADSFQQQLDYTLELVATGRIPRESGAQIELMDLLIDAGATPGSGLGAFAHGNTEAGKHLIEGSGTLTLATAVCADRMNDAVRLAEEAGIAEQQVALIAAAFYGRLEMIVFLLGLGIDPNVYVEPSSGFHSHATALHQAVFSGSLQSVKVLVEAGARPDLKDRIYEGTALDWAEHMQTTEERDAEAKKRFGEIAAYLREKNIQ